MKYIVLRQSEGTIIFRTTGAIPMKKLCAGLLILLLISCAFVFSLSKKTAAMKETEKQLISENEKLTEQVSTIQENITAKDSEITDLSEEKKPVLEAQDVWEQRTEEIRPLLSD